MLTRPDALLRLEALLVLSASVAGYRVMLHGSWWFFALLFLAPDLSLCGYAAKRHLGFAAAVYNTAHNYILPALLGAAAWHWASPRAGQIAGIWIAHVAFDRVLGYGLKFREGFKPTHIQSSGVSLVPAPAVPVIP
jgi:hypothetical protein